MPSCNFFIKREVFIQIGMMNEALSGGEDFELCSRLKREKLPIRYDGAITVFHKSRNIKSFLKKRLSYGGFAYDNIVKNFSVPILFTICPAFLILFIASFPLAFLNNVYACFYVFVILLYFLICAVEAVRLSETMSQLLPLLLLFIVGTLTPGLGSLARMVKLLPSYKTIYRNFE